MVMVLSVPAGASFNETMLRLVVISEESEFPSLMLQVSVRFAEFFVGYSELFVNATERSAACHSAMVADCESDARLSIPSS